MSMNTESSLRISNEVYYWMLKELDFEEPAVWELVDRAAERFSLFDDNGWPIKGLRQMAAQAEMAHTRKLQEDAEKMWDERD